MKNINFQTIPGSCLIDFHPCFQQVNDCILQEKASNKVVSAPVATPASIDNDVRSVPIDEAPLVALQAPELQLATPSSKGQRNLQDSTFSISGENPNGLHEPQSGSCPLVPALFYVFLTRTTLGIAIENYT